LVRALLIESQSETWNQNWVAGDKNMVSHQAELVISRSTVYTRCRVTLRLTTLPSAQSLRAAPARLPVVPTTELADAPGGASA
jgi:hypothetical protein